MREGGAEVDVSIGETDLMNATLAGALYTSAPAKMGRSKTKGPEGRVSAPPVSIAKHLA